MRAVVSRPACERAFKPAEPDQAPVPCEHTALWSALLRCTKHDATAVQNICARCSVLADTKGFKCGVCQERTVVIVALLRLDGVA